jgi:aldehyde dehydrogenase (NAD+)
MDRMVKTATLFPSQIPNWIHGQECAAVGKAWLEKIRPSDETQSCHFARSRGQDIDTAVQVAKKAQPDWEQTPGVQRGMILYQIVSQMQSERETLARVVADETGKSIKDALAETNAAIELGLFYAGEGQRMYGRTTTSAKPNRHAMTVRQPIGVAGLIISANTPIANIAWKVFPAFVCGNAVVLKASEDAPATAWLFSQIAHRAGLPAGLCNVLQGLGPETGSALVEHPGIGVLSFTGSTAVGTEIASRAGKRLLRLSLELGGKNPLVVCDDADLENAAKWVLLSAFSNAGQRCAAASRIIIFDSIYPQFRDLLVERTRKLRVGSTAEDDFGPVINRSHCDKILAELEAAQGRGARLLCGGNRLSRPGFYLEPTLLEDVSPQDPLSQTEIFGPAACLYRAKNFSSALALANDTLYGLTACIHTRDLDRAFEFSHRVQSGVAMVNAGTFGSEPHMPFGGRKRSGNGSREPGTEALDVYSELKDIYIQVHPEP